MAATPAQGTASKTLGHLRITIRHFLGRRVQGVVVAGSTGRVARRPGMPPVGQDRPAGRLGGYAPTGNLHQRFSPGVCFAFGRQASAPRVPQRPLRAIRREAGVGAMKAAVVFRRGLHASPKTAQDSPDRREAGVGGLSARKRARHFLKPFAAHLAARYAPIGEPISTALPGRTQHVAYAPVGSVSASSR